MKIIFKCCCFRRWRILMRRINKYDFAWCGTNINYSSSNQYLYISLCSNRNQYHIPYSFCKNDMRLRTFSQNYKFYWKVVRYYGLQWQINSHTRLSIHYTLHDSDNVYIAISYTTEYGAVDRNPINTKPHSVQDIHFQLKPNKYILTVQDILFLHWIS